MNLESINEKQLLNYLLELQDYKKRDKEMVEWFKKFLEENDRKDIEMVNKIITEWTRVLVKNIAEWLTQCGSEDLSDLLIKGYGNIEFGKETAR